MMQALLCVIGLSQSLFSYKLQYYRLQLWIPSLHGPFCVTQSENVDANGDFPLLLDYCETKPSPKMTRQAWQFIPDNEGRYEIQIQTARYHFGCVENKNNVPVVAANCTGSEEQKFGIRYQEDKDYAALDLINGFDHFSLGPESDYRVGDSLFFSDQWGLWLNYRIALFGGQ